MKKRGGIISGLAVFLLALSAVLRVFVFDDDIKMCEGSIKGTIVSVNERYVQLESENGYPFTFDVQLHPYVSDIEVGKKYEVEFSYPCDDDIAFYFLNEIKPLE